MKTKVQFSRRKQTVMKAMYFHSQQNCFPKFKFLICIMFYKGRILMENRLWLLVAAFSMALFCTAQVSAQEDETDLSRYKIVDEEKSFPTIIEFKRMEDEARALYKKKDCEQFIPLASEAASVGNKLANIVRQGLEPFYDANRDDQKIIPRKLGADFDKLAEAETAGNNLVLIRNEFWVMEAVCLIETGQRDQGINKLYRALDYVDPLKQTALWKEAREAIWASIAYK